MVMIYTSTQCQNDCFRGQIVKTQKQKILGVGDQSDKNDHYFRSYMRQETLIDQYELLYACAL